MNEIIFSRGKFLVGSALATAVFAFGGEAIIGSTPSFAAPGIDLDTGYRSSGKCVENGFKYTRSGNIAEGPHCFATTDRSTKPVLATVDKKKTANDLKLVESWSPLSPTKYLARGTMATRRITNAPKHSQSSIMASAVAKIPSLYNNLGVITGVNVGNGVHAHDNIPIYTVDSSNPAQKYATFRSNDARVVNFPGIKRVNTGKIPLPTWAKPSDGGDKALAIYDVATGIWRSYFHVVKTGTSTYSFASGGYWYADDIANRRAGDSNYWLSLIQGTSSVIGLSNELTQIGFEEVKKGSINHMVSVTFANYPSEASFPAKQSDGNLPKDKYPVAPKAGQIFTFPKTMDIDKYCADNNLDELTKMIMKAIQTHGGIIADRNFFCHAFNFENPYGIAEYASVGKNAWKEDAKAKRLINGFQANKFPWAKTEWIAENYAGVLTNAWSKDPISSVSFKDVDSTVIFRPEILALAERDIIRGWNDNTFRPYNNVLRDAVIVFIYRAMGKPAHTPPAKSPFVDVSTNNVFYHEITWAYQNGITNGWLTSRGREFRPLAPVKRDAIAAFLLRATDKYTPGIEAQVKKNGAKNNVFKDVHSQQHVFAAEIEWLNSTGISTGWKVSDGWEFRPLQNTKRDAMAAFIYRWMKHVNRL